VTTQRPAHSTDIAIPSGDSTDAGDLIQMSTSTDGGITWSAAVGTQGNDFGIGGLPLVKPNGKVIVPDVGIQWIG